MHLNKVVLIGTVVKDPQIRYAGAAQVPVTDVRVVVNRVWKSPKGEKREDAVFIDVVAWARSAETCVQYLKKGRMIGVEGRLTMDEWTAPDGKKNSRIRITSDRIIFLPQGEGRGQAAPEPDGSELEEMPASIPA
ncbi:MAG: single-stranded DNA-binding protein [Candidatus Brocadiae bacterium]|nr:single-stranded DNA-binding protein [Candidatus Brocadiia bacterium]